MGSAGAGERTQRATRAERRARPDPRSAGPADRPEARPATGGDGPTPEHDARLERMDRVAVLYAQITAATREFLAAVAESDRHEDWAEAGFGSCAEWLAWRLGVTRNTANEKVRVARALDGLPRISAEMRRGALSYSKECAAYCTSWR